MNNEMLNKNNRLIIAGAGPGDPELISVKALKEIRKADVILYDALINNELLNFAKQGCHKIFVGKRANKHLIKQNEINKLCVKYANNFKNVLRLKGGDPFIFGRGFEELEYAKLNGIDVEIIPGISSATALAGLNGIPLTCRDVNHGFSVVTAVDKFGELTDELINSAKSELTTVILMGFSRLREISVLYENLGNGNVPAILISNGSLENEKKYISTIGQLYNETLGKKIETPAIIIVGKVVTLYKSLTNELQNEYTISNISKAI